MEVDGRDLLVQDEAVVNKATFAFVIVRAFYPLLLMVSHEVSVHFHPRLRGRVSDTLGGIIFCKAVSSSTRYGVTSRYARTYLGIP